MKKWLMAAILALPAALAQGGDWGGTVIGVHDGDTLSILRNGMAEKVRLDEIDAPELGQDYGRQSKQSLSAICYGRQAEVEDHGTDKYGRSLGRVVCGGVDANAEQIRRGYAWFYVKYGRDPALRELEASARTRRAGLWAMANPVPPWEFRHRDQPAAAYPGYRARPYGHGTGSSCEPRKHCANFGSCAEAMSYLRRCGASALDRNHDGVPCESTLCKW